MSALEVGEVSMQQDGAPMNLTPLDCSSLPFGAMTGRGCEGVTEKEGHAER